MAKYPIYSSRKIINLSGVWQFRFQENCSLEDINGVDFEADSIMTVPGVFDAMPELMAKTGTGLYKNCFVVEEVCSDAILKIEGLGLRAKFWIDNKEVGMCKMPYSPYAINIGALEPGQHTIHVHIDNTADPEKLKLFRSFYDFYGYGGFYRGISLHLIDKAWYFDRVQVKTLDYLTGKVQLKFLFGGNVPETVKVDYAFDEGVYSSVDLKVENGSATIDVFVPGAKCWSPDNPNLHCLNAKTETDSIVERFGVREIKAVGREMLLNGEKIYLLGVNRHESHPDFGPALPEQIMLKDLLNLKTLNGNFIRGSHYPQDQAFIELCDELGVLVWEESLGWGDDADYLKDKEFADFQEEELRLMIRESINHPSVIIRAFLNEFHSQTQEGYDLCKRLVTVAREEDDSTLVSFACNHGQSDICTPLVDVISINSYPFWYEGFTDPSMEKCIKTHLNSILKYLLGINPEPKPVIMSEIGCQGLYGEHDLSNAQWSEEFQAEYLENVMKKLYSTLVFSGIAIWQMNDSKSTHRLTQSVRGKPLSYNSAGIFDRYRRPKLAASSVKNSFALKR